MKIISSLADFIAEKELRPARYVEDVYGHSTDFEGSALDTNMLLVYPGGVWMLATPKGFVLDIANQSYGPSWNVQDMEEILYDFAKGEHFFPSNELELEQMRQDNYLKEMKEKLREFATLWRTLHGIFGESAIHVDSNYPFEQSFDDLTHQVQHWVNSTINLCNSAALYLPSQRAFMCKNPQNGELWLHDQPLLSLSNQILITMSLEERNMVFERFKFDVWGDPAIIYDEQGGKAIIRPATVAASNDEDPEHLREYIVYGDIASGITPELYSYNKLTTKLADDRGFFGLYDWALEAKVRDSMSHENFQIMRIK